MPLSPELKRQRQEGLSSNPVPHSKFQQGIHSPVSNKQVKTIQKDLISCGFLESITHVALTTINKDPLPQHWTATSRGSLS